MKKAFGWILVVSVFVMFPVAFLVWWAYAIGKKRSERRYQNRSAMLGGGNGFAALRGTSPPPGRGSKRWTKIDGYVGDQFI